MQGIGVIFGEGRGCWRYTKVAWYLDNSAKILNRGLISSTIRHHNGHSTPSQRSFYAFISPSILYHNGHYPPSHRHSTPSQRTIIVIYSPSLAYIYANPTDHYDIPIRLYPSQSLSSIIRQSNAISTDNTP